MANFVALLLFLYLLQVLNMGRKREERQPQRQQQREKQHPDSNLHAPMEAEPPIPVRRASRVVTSDLPSAPPQQVPAERQASAAPPQVSAEPQVPLEKRVGSMTSTARQGMIWSIIYGPPRAILSLQSERQRNRR